MSGVHTAAHIERRVDTLHVDDLGVSQNDPVPVAAKQGSFPNTSPLSAPFLTGSSVRWSAVPDTGQMCAPSRVMCAPLVVTGPDSKKPRTGIPVRGFFWFGHTPRTRRRRWLISVSSTRSASRLSA